MRASLKYLLLIICLSVSFSSLSSKEQISTSGIIDWVLRTDFWDTTPLTHRLSYKQLLAIRIDHNLASMPHLRQLWLSIERKKSNPMEIAISKYQADKNLQDAMIDLTEFESYFKRSGSKAAQGYLSNIQTLLTGMQQQATKRISSDLFTTLGSTELLKDNTSKTTQFFTNDLLEWTKPSSLTFSQWHQLVLHEK